MNMDANEHSENDEKEAKKKLSSLILSDDPNDGTFQKLTEYATEHAKDGVWGTEIDIAAIAWSERFRICIYIEDKKGGYKVVGGVGPTKAQKIHLCNVGNYHYQPMILQ